MKCKLTVPVIEPTEPFKNCKLGRQKYAEIITQIVGQYEDGCVLALNGEWGTGKTTFVKMWEQYLRNHDIQTLYFNVWENDFISDPMIGLMGELKKLILSDEHTKDYTALVATSVKVLLATVPGIAKGLAKKILGEESEEAIEGGVREITEYLKGEINSYDERCKTLESFRKTLETYVSKFANEKRPVIFFIDELDRCNPTYAVKVLERVKHLFNIPKIVFVLSVDKKQLCNSIRGYFGSDRINAEEYLRRFIDIEYTMPEPDQSAFVDYLNVIYGFKEYYKTNESFFRQYGEDNASFKDLCIALFKYKKLCLRDMEKFFNHISLISKMIPSGHKYFPNMLVLLEYYKLFASDIYDNIKEKRYSIDELVRILEDLPSVVFGYKDTNNLHYNNAVVSTIVTLMSAYNVYINDYDAPLIQEDDGQYKLTFKTKHLNTEFVKNNLKAYQGKHFSVFSCALKNICEYIDLAKDLNGISLHGY